MPKLELTQSFIEAVKVESNTSSTDYYDKKVIGLLLKVLPSGRKTFYLRYKDTENCSCKRKIGNAAILSVIEARDLARLYLAKISLGQDPFLHAPINPSPTLGSFALEDYLPYVKTYKKSWNMDESRLRNHLLPRFSE